MNDFRLLVAIPFLNNPANYVRFSVCLLNPAPPPGAHLPDFWREKNLNFNYSGELRKQLRTHKKS